MNSYWEWTWTIWYRCSLRRRTVPKTETLGSTISNSSSIGLLKIFKLPVRVSKRLVPTSDSLFLYKASSDSCML